MKPLGFGAYGNVYLYQDGEAQYAIKIIKLNQGKYRQLIEPLLVTNFNHPYLCRSLNTYVIDSVLYSWFQLALADLEVWRRSYQPTPEQLRTWTWQLLQAVAYLHHRGVIHGDIKPSNILVMDLSTVQLTDLSLATLDGWSHRFTACTFICRPPEAWGRHDWTNKVDIWALGVSLYYLATGTYPLPFIDKTGWGDTQECRDLYQDLFSLWEDYKKGLALDSDLGRIIDRCLSIDRPTAAELITDPWFDGLTPVDLTDPPITDQWLIDRLVAKGVQPSLAQSLIERIGQRRIDNDNWDYDLTLIDLIDFRLD